MPHIHTQQGQHDLTTTAFIVRTGTSEPKVLVHMHKKLGFLLPVGGHVELNETPWSAVLHEIEEAGYESRQLTILQPRDRIKQMDDVKIHPVPLFLQTHQVQNITGHSHIDIGFVFVTTEDPAHKPAEGESTDLRWLTLKDASNTKTDMPPDVYQIIEFVLDTALPQWEHISIESFDV